MAEPTVYLFDGYNLLHAGSFGSEAELLDALSSFLALRGVRGVLVFDGEGADRQVGPLAVRYARHADTLLERLATELRERERVCLVSSDVLLRTTSGQAVGKVSSRAFLRELPADAGHRERGRMQVGDRLDAATRARLDRLRRRT